MFFLVTGASGAGKTTVRLLVEKTFDARLVSAAFAILDVKPEWNLEWRHKMVEPIVQLAIKAQQEGRHFLLCGDPVPLGELLASPSADQLDAVLACLLDMSETARRERLTARRLLPMMVGRRCVGIGGWDVTMCGHRGTFM